MSTKKRERMGTFNDRLKSERKRLGISQDKLAEIAGVARKSVVNYESGLRIPDATYLAAITAAGADVTYIITGVRTSVPTLSREEECLLDNYRHSDEAGKATIQATMSIFAQASHVAKSGKKAG